MRSCDVQGGAADVHRGIDAAVVWDARNIDADPGFVAAGCAADLDAGSRTSSRSSRHGGR